MAVAMEREQIVYRSLLTLAGVDLAGPERMLSVWHAAASPWPSLLVCVPLHAATALLMPSRGRELSYMAVATEREKTAYRSLRMVARVVLADPEPMASRLARSCIALAFTACVHAIASSHRLGC